ncbi:hypothetical protein NDU88_008739 [Pleurodeles waltl]|uniref:Uncharacterized protein n=1 Tax=Pleurodeles waltl TaxID=8319 RepID=A0AAV7PQ17_PLEWA|nr:hypothetical protein NDU88_008739 [Pleurodeles waltl]
MARLESSAPDGRTCLECLGLGADGWRPRERWMEVGCERIAGWATRAAARPHSGGASKRAWPFGGLERHSPGREAERNPPASKSKRGRVRRGHRRGGAAAEAAAHAPDLEQLIQERRKALQLAAAVGASLSVSESETEISQHPSDRPATLDRLSEELGFFRNVRLGLLPTRTTFSRPCWGIFGWPGIAVTSCSM